MRRIEPLACTFTLAVLLLSSLLPALWVGLASLQPVGAPPPTQITDIMRWPTLQPYAELMNTALPAQLLRSALLALMAAAGAVAMGAGAGYALLHLPRRWQNPVAVLLLLMFSAPAAALWLGRFVIIRSLGLMDTPLALLLPQLSTGGLLGALLFWRAFARLGSDYLDAARLDADGHLPVLRVLLAAARPAVLACAALTFALVWADALSPVHFVSSPSLATWPLGLSALAQLERTHVSLLMAGAVVATCHCC